MMEGLIRYFVSKTFLVNMLCAAIVIFGFIALFDMHRDLIPATEKKEISISIQIDGLSAKEIEQAVTIPIEEAVRSVPGIKEMTSSSSSQNSSISLKFQSNEKNLDAKLKEIESRVDVVRPRFPQGKTEISIRQIRQDSINVMSVSVLHADGENEEHRKSVYRIRDALLELDGVVGINSYLPKKQLLVELDPKKLEEVDIPITQIRAILLKHLSIAPVGQILSEGKTVALELSPTQFDANAIRQIPLRSNATGQLVRLDQVAKVELGYPKNHRSVVWLYKGSRDTAYLGIEKDLYTDAVKLKEAVFKIVEEQKKLLPAPLELDVTGDGPFFIEKQLSVLRTNGAIGLTIVILALTLFLGWRAAMMTAIGIPLAYLATCIVLNQMGFAFDLVSVCAMIIIIGILVDDAIIVSERYVENLSRGLYCVEAAVQAARDLAIPVAGTILTTIIAFSPIMIVDGDLKSILFAIPVVITTALAVSWMECFLVLPNHLQVFVGAGQIRENFKFFEWFKGFYRKSLSIALRWRYVAVAIFSVWIGFTLYIAKAHIRTKFDLRVGSERIVVNMELKESRDLEHSIEQFQPFIHQAVAVEDPDLDKSWTRVGAAWMDGKYRQNHRLAQVMIFVKGDISKPQESRKRLQEQFAEIVEQYKKDDGERFSLLEVRKQVSGQEESKDGLVNIEFSGGDESEFAEIQDRFQKQVEGLEGMTAVSIDEDLLERTWRFEPKADSLAQYGVTQTELSQKIREVLGSNTLSEFRVGREFIDLVTRIGPEREIRFEELQNIQIHALHNLRVPMKVLGSWREVKNLKSFNHSDGKRIFEIGLKFDPEKTKKEDFIKAAKAKVEPLARTLQGYRVEVVDADKQAKENQTWILKILGYCIGLILLILALTLGSLTQPMLVGSAIPFGILGTLWVYYLHGKDLDIMAMIGLLGVAGVAVNGSLVMVYSINQMRQKRKSLLNEQIIEGAVGRLRAVLLTTMTTLGGLFPMAYGWGGESGFTSPLAFSMGWGILFSTALTLIFIPVFLKIRADIGWLGRWIWAKVTRQKAGSWTVEVPQGIAVGSDGRIASDQKSRKDSKDRPLGPGLTSSSPFPKVTRKT